MSYIVAELQKVLKIIRRRKMKKILMIVLAVLFVSAVMATRAENQDKIVKELMPATDLKPQVYSLTAADIASVQKVLDSDKPVRDTYQIYVTGKEAVVVEEQMGKWGIIYMAILINTETKKAVDIGFIDMVEKRGVKVKEGYFKNQFKDKSLTDACKVGEDIKGISGATISSKAVCVAVKRALMIYDLFSKNPKKK